MKEKFLSICRCLVGDEGGFEETGCDQWYYTLYVAISIMFAWRNYPDIAPYYMTVLIVEYLIVSVYGYFSLSDFAPALPIIYLSLIATTTIALFILNWKLALVATLINVTGILVSPDENGQSIVFHFPESEKWRALISNAIYLGIFIYATLILPVDVGTKVIIVVAAILLHPFIDAMDRNNICYYGNLLDSVFTLLDYKDERKDQKYQKEKETTKNENAPR